MSWSEEVESFSFSRFRDRNFEMLTGKWLESKIKLSFDKEEGHSIFHLSIPVPSIPVRVIPERGGYERPEISSSLKK